MTLKTVLFTVLLVWETTLVIFKSSFSPKIGKNLLMIDRIIEDMTITYTRTVFFPNLEI